MTIGYTKLLQMCIKRITKKIDAYAWKASYLYTRYNSQMSLNPLSKKKSIKKHKKIPNLWKRKIGLESFEVEKAVYKALEHPGRRYPVKNGYDAMYLAGVDPVTGDVFELGTWPNETGRIGEMAIYNLGTRDEYIEGCDGDQMYYLSFPEVGMAKDLVKSLTKRKSLGVLRRGYGGQPFREKNVKTFLKKLESMTQGVSGSPTVDVIDHWNDSCIHPQAYWQEFTLDDGLLLDIPHAGLEQSQIDSFY